MNELPDKHALDSDMSEAGINRRLRKLSQLYQLGLSLRKARGNPSPRLIARESRPGEEGNRG